MQEGSGAHGTHHPPQTSLYEALGQPLRHLGGTLAQTLVNLSLLRLVRLAHYAPNAVNDNLYDILLTFFIVLK